MPEVGKCLLKITVEYYEKVETFQEKVFYLPYQQCMKYVSGNSNKIGKIFNIRKKSEIRILAFVWNWLSAEYKGWIWLIMDGIKF